MSFGLHEQRIFGTRQRDVTPVTFYHGSQPFRIIFFQASFAAKFARNLDTKKTPPNIEVCSESLRAMLQLSI